MESYSDLFFVVRDLVVHVDFELTMKQHVRMVAAVCFYHLHFVHRHRLRKIRPRVGQQLSSQLVMTHVVPWLGNISLSWCRTRRSQLHCTASPSAQLKKWGRKLQGIREPLSWGDEQRVQQRRYSDTLCRQGVAIPLTCIIIVHSWLPEAFAETGLCQRDHRADFNDDHLTDSEIMSVLDRLIPAKTVTIRRRPSDRWWTGNFNSQSTKSDGWIVVPPPKDAESYSRVVRRTGSCTLSPAQRLICVTYHRVTPVVHMILRPILFLLYTAVLGCHLHKDEGRD